VIVEAGKYEEALKTLYLKTDEDLRAGKYTCGIPGEYPLIPRLDPNFFNEPSGCTAVSTVLTTDGRIICVSAALLTPESPTHTDI
jgi:protein phosphatase 2C family protein 2/3